MQEEITQKTIALSMKTGKLTAQALQAALKKYLQHRAKGPKLHHGKQSLKQLKAHGAALTNIEVTEANVGAFKPCAKKYGVDFTLRKDKTTQPPHYIVIFKAKDADNLSTTKLTRGFSSFYGMPIHQYIIEQRLTQAAQLLLEGDRNVSEIAAIVGYGKPSNLAAAFKKRYGVAPKNYRESRFDTHKK